MGSWKGRKPLPAGGYVEEAIDVPLGGKRKRKSKAKKSGGKLGKKPYGAWKLKAHKF